MSDLTTKFILEVDGKGFPKAEKDVGKLGDTLDSSIGQAADKFDELDKQIHAVQKTITRMTTAVSKSLENGFDTRKIVKQIRALKKELADLNAGDGSGGGGGDGGGGGSGGGGGGRGFGGKRRSTEPEKPRSFMQGLQQGVLPNGVYMDRGPGSVQQFKGFQIGRGVSQVGSAIASGGDAAGLASGVGSIASGAMLGGPVAAGAAAVLAAGGASFSRASGYSPLALGYQQQQMQGMPYLGRGAMRAPEAAFDQGTLAGGELGASATDVLAYRTQVSQRSGLGLGATQAQGLDTLGLAATKRYGLGAGDVGAFVQAGAMGGTTSKDSGSDQMVDAINQGMKLALDGSDMQAFIGHMADDISSWKQTGITLDTKSMGDLAQNLSVVGNMGGVRGSNAAFGVAQGMQNMGANGPQRAEDFEMLRKMGANSSDPMSILAARRKLMDPRNAGEAGSTLIQEMRDVARRGSSDDSAFFAVKNIAESHGLKMGYDELSKATKQFRSTGADADKQGQEMLETLKKGYHVDENGQYIANSTNASDIQKSVAGATPQMLKDQASQQAKQIGIGENATGFVQRMGRAADDFADAAGRGMNAADKLAKMLSNASASADAFAKSLDTANPAKVSEPTPTPTTTVEP